MKIEVNIAALGRSKWHEYFLRFAFGGVVTALAGIIAKHYGPELGGLFLAFPAIFPATATLLEKHEEQKKEQAGIAGKIQARKIAGLDAAGAGLGSLGLIAFAVVVWKWLPYYPEALVLGVATAAWSLTSVIMFVGRETIGKKIRMALSGKESREFLSSKERSSKTTPQ